MKYVLLFTTPTCQPCKVMKPILEELTKDRFDMKYQEVNCWEERELVQRFKVRSSPTLIILDDDRLVADIRGLATREDIEEIINREE